MTQSELFDIGTAPKGKPETYRLLAEKAEQEGCEKLARGFREAEQAAKERESRTKAARR